jgi:hypothetical protein
MAAPKINVQFIYPPIPIRQFDYCATYDGDEPNDAGGIEAGWGATKAEAMSDLTTNYPREI